MTTRTYGLLSIGKSFTITASWTWSARRAFLRTFQTRLVHPEVPYRTRRVGEAATTIFPDHEFPMFDPSTVVVDGDAWEIGTRGNDPATVLAEVRHTDRLEDAEVAEFTAWLRDEYPEQDLIRRIRAGTATEADVTGAELTAPVRDNLLLNLRLLRARESREQGVAHDGSVP